MNIRYLFSYPTSLAMKLLLFRLLCKFGVSHLKKLDPWGLATPEALPWKIEGFSCRVRKGHESRLSRTCHWRRGRMPAAVRSRCIRQRTTRFTEIAASGLFCENRESNSQPASCTPASLPLCALVACHFGSSYFILSWMTFTLNFRVRYIFGCWLLP